MDIDRQRGWHGAALGWRHGQTSRAGVTHGAAVRKAAFSPDGRRILTASDDGTAPLGGGHRATSGAVSESRGRGRLCLRSPDGRLAATGSADRPPGSRDGGPGNPGGAAESQGDRNPSRSAETVGVLHRRAGRRACWEADTGASAFAETRSAHSGPWPSLPMTRPSPSPRPVHRPSYGGATGKPRGDPFAIHKTVLALQFMPDGRLVSGSFDTLLRFWDPRRASRSATRGAPGRVRTWPSGADGTRVASGVGTTPGLEHGRFVRRGASPRPPGGGQLPGFSSESPFAGDRLPGSRRPTDLGSGIRFRANSTAAASGAAKGPVGLPARW